MYARAGACCYGSESPLAKDYRAFFLIDQRDLEMGAEIRPLLEKHSEFPCGSTPDAGDPYPLTAALLHHSANRGRKVLDSVDVCLCRSLSGCAHVHQFCKE